MALTHLEAGVDELELELLQLQLYFEQIELFRNCLPAPLYLEGIRESERLNPGFSNFKQWRET